MRKTLDNISKEGSSGLGLFKQYQIISDLLSGDVPVNWIHIGPISSSRIETGTGDQDRSEFVVQSVGEDETGTGDQDRSEFVVQSVGEDDVQSIPQQFLDSPGRCRVYEHVGAVLVHVYQTLYTKIPLRKFLYIDCPYHIYMELAHACSASSLISVVCYIICLLYLLVQFASAPIALVLFWAAQKGHQDQLHTSPADITVSYILLIGAIALDVSATISTFPSYYQVPSAWCNKKHWSKKLGQYSIINRHVGLPEVIHTPMNSKDDGDKGSPSPIKEFILDKLLGFGTRKQWNIATFRGRWAIQEWMNTNGIPDSERARKALIKTNQRRHYRFPNKCVHLAHCNRHMLLPVRLHTPQTTTPAILALMIDSSPRSISRSAEAIKLYHVPYLQVPCDAHYQLPVCT
jgi:hypothetical protein